VPSVCGTFVHTRRILFSSCVHTCSVFVCLSHFRTQHFVLCMRSALILCEWVTMARCHIKRIIYSHDVDASSYLYRLCSHEAGSSSLFEVCMKQASAAISSASATKPARLDMLLIPVSTQAAPRKPVNAVTHGCFRFK